MLLRSEGAKARERRAEQAQAKAHDTRREWGAVKTLNQLNCYKENIEKIIKL